MLGPHVLETGAELGNGGVLDTHHHRPYPSNTGKFAASKYVRCRGSSAIREVLNA
jgi:hypothetical protein